MQSSEHIEDVESVCVIGDAPDNYYVGCTTVCVCVWGGGVGGYIHLGNPLSNSWLWPLTCLVAVESVCVCVCVHVYVGHVHK